MPGAELSGVEVARADLRSTARALFEAGVAAADPADAVRSSLRTAPVEATRIVAVGKAALAMATAARETLPDAELLVVTNEENAVAAPPGWRVLVAAHPVPDAGGAAAAREVEAFAATAGDGETVLVLVSGGGSAMLPAPIEGVSLDDKIALTAALLASGAPIDEMNAVRRALSRLKGGGLARTIHPARTVALLLSDVPHDEIAAIASGPTVPGAKPDEAARDALRVLGNHGLLARAPEAVRAALEARALERAGDAGAAPNVENRLVGGNALSVRAMHDAARARGIEAMRMDGWADGDVGIAAKRMHELARRAPSPVQAVLMGGETTVRLRGTGQGGRNQEFALRFALECEADPLPREWAFVSGGTDGRDGPTDAAGGLVDRTTLSRIEANGEDARALLANNDSYAALKAGDALLMTGATGTNVADLQVLVLGPEVTA